MEVVIIENVVSTEWHNTATSSGSKPDRMIQQEAGSGWLVLWLGLGQQVLLAVLPEKNGSSDMYIKGAYHAQLRYLHTLIHHVDQLNWNTFSLVPACIMVW